MNSPIKADELFASWARHQWKSSYLFAGQEDFLIEQAVHQLADHWLAGDASGFNRDRFDADSASTGEILQAAQTMPLMGKCRLIQVDHAAALSSQEQSLLAEALPALPPENRVLFIWGKEWRRDEAKKPLAEAVSENGQIVIFWPLFPEQAQRWLLERARLYKKTLSREAAGWLVQQAGEGLRLLDQELMKSSAYVGGRPAIELEDLQASFGYGKAGSPFEWLAAIRRRSGPQALRLLETLLEEGEEPLKLLALVSKVLRDWLSAKGSRESSTILAMRFHVRRGEEQRFAQELAQWSQKDLMEGLGNCLEAEQTIKTGKEPPPMALTLLTLRLCGLQPAHAG